MNNNYRNGRAREYRIQNKLRAEGFVCLRTAGSHGFCDLICLDPQTSIVTFIQVKPTSLSTRKKTALQSQNSWVERNWTGKNKVVSSYEELA